MKELDSLPRYDLVETLVGTARILSLVGAGGKKSTLYALARALPGRVAVTSSSHMAAYDTRVVDDIVRVSSEGDPRALPAQGRIVALGGEAESLERIRGLSPAQIEQLAADSRFEHVLIKADGARARWVKAPAAYEPVVPPCTDRVLYFVSAQVLGAPLDERIAHRVEHLAMLCGTVPGAVLTVGHLATLLTSEQGALQGVGRCEVLPVINMVDSAALAAAARELACLALRNTTRFERVVLTHMKTARVIDVVTRKDAWEQQS